ncbi:acetyl-CoA C-acetyltransferase [Paenibacillus sp. J5C_2022]|uniref:acetyl-CoA C-acetyltransferase n=1 Tax=Paenibacillus sp. J5C2022 TaxID=2977129 RepID=UPI0021CE3E4D|nr:acetyl-CoA C-acetyltransferase [Paenibacillus sp. J5C2022]MCU6707452.1 acetyl-CoA C-acetyltransferase [Paenibacillus sp. J5C2022]
MTRRSVIVSAARTPFGKLGGCLKDVPAIALGGIAIREAISRAGIDDDLVDLVMMGMVLQGGSGQNPARQAARHAGMPWTASSETINKVCASGLRAVALADQIIRAGDAEVTVAGGMESMSNAPHFLPRFRWGNRMGNAEAIDLMLHDGLRCPFNQVQMAEYGNLTAKEYGITRGSQDEWALRSHMRALKATSEGKLQEEIVPVKPPDGKKQVNRTFQLSTDEAPRQDANRNALSRLPPLYESDGTITAGNAPGVNDGAGALVVMSEERAKVLGKRPLASIIGHAEVALEAPYIAKAAAAAVQKLLRKTGFSLSGIDLFEINEAFASVVLTGSAIIGWDEAKVNVNGGAIALGHPIGASGARILMTLLYELRRRGGGYGIAAICSGTAQGDAMLVKVD